MDFTREELWALKHRAEKEMGMVTNPDWIRAYEQFIHAISTMDAFIARSSVPANITIRREAQTEPTALSNMPEADTVEKLREVHEPKTEAA